jgi:hypothetical protein
MDQESRNRMESVASGDEPIRMSAANALAEAGRREQAKAAGVIPESPFKRVARRVIKALQG